MSLRRSSKNTSRNAGKLASDNICFTPYDRDLKDFLQERTLKGLKESELMRDILRKHYIAERWKRNPRNPNRADDEMAEPDWLKAVLEPLDMKISSIEKKTAQTAELIRVSLRALSRVLETNPRMTALLELLKDVRERLDVLPELTDSLQRSRDDVLKCLVPLYALQKHIYANTFVLVDVLTNYLEPTIGKDVQQFKRDSYEDAFHVISKVEDTLKVWHALINETQVSISFPGEEESEGEERVE